MADRNYVENRIGASSKQHASAFFVPTCMYVIPTTTYMIKQVQYFIHARFDH